jgi:hypothetical protein
MNEFRQKPLTRAQVDLPLLARRASALLEAGVPLTLLIDLSDPAGPRSRDVYESEPATTEWLTTAS